MSRPILLDTCAAIWLANGDEMEPTALDHLREVLGAGAGVFVSPITAWEIGMLVAKGRVSLTSRPEAWFRMLMGRPGLLLAAMHPEILIASSFLPGSPPADPADRMIAATARELNYRLMTRDGRLLSYGAAGHVEVLAC